MKKIIALLLIAATLLSFAACSGDGGEVNTDPVANANDFAANQAALDAEYSKKAAEKAAEESKIQEEINEYVAKVGKTEKKTQLVVEIVDWSLGKKYYKFEFNKKGEFKSQTQYFFYDSLENYYANLEIEKNKEDTKVIDKDKDMKMIVVKNSGFNGQDFDKMYENYSGETAKELGYSVVE